MIVRTQVTFIRTIAATTLVVFATGMALPSSALANDTVDIESLLDDSDLSVDKAAEQLRNATPQMREKRLEHLSARLLAASRWERRRMLRREGRIMRALPSKEREKIEAENDAFRDKHGILSIRDRLDLADTEEFDYTRKERRVLRARFRDLPKKERVELVRKIKNVRELPEDEKRELYDRLEQMKSLSSEEKDEFRAKAKRWSDMPDERKEKLREQMRKLRAMPVEERMELLEKAMESQEDE